MCCKSGPLPPLTYTIKSGFRCFLRLRIPFVQVLAAAIQQRLAQSPVVQDKRVERANGSKVPWLVVSPDGVCSVAHKLSAAPTDSSNDDGKRGKQLVRPATLRCSCQLACEPASPVCSTMASPLLHQCVANSLLYMCVLLSLCRACSNLTSRDLFVQTDSSLLCQPS